MFVYYAYDSYVTGQGLTPVIKKTKPNGSNCYYFNKQDLVKIEALLPPSHVSLDIPERILPINKRLNVFENAKVLKAFCEYLLKPPGTLEVIVHTINYEEGISKGEGYYYPVYKDGDMITIPEKDVDTYLTKIKSMYQEDVIEKPAIQESLKPGNSRSSDSCYLYDEPHIVTFPAPYLDVGKEKLHLEYLAWIAFINVCKVNRWLRPYAGRVSHKMVGITAEGGSVAGSIMIPYWDENSTNEFEAISEIISIKLPDPTLKNEDVLRLSDGNKYPYPFKVGWSIPSNDFRSVNFRDEIWDLVAIKSSQVPMVDWRLKNFSRVSEFIPKGVVPLFDDEDEYYPEPSPLLKISAKDRIKVEEDKAGVVVSLVPNCLILGSHGSNIGLDRIEKFYEKLWSNGTFLNNYGHNKYRDNYSKVDEKGIRLIHLSDEQLLALENSILD